MPVASNIKNSGLGADSSEKKLKINAKAGLWISRTGYDSLLEKQH